VRSVQHSLLFGAAVLVVACGKAPTGDAKLSEVAARRFLLAAPLPPPRVGLAAIQPNVIELTLILTPSFRIDAVVLDSGSDQDQRELLAAVGRWEFDVKRLRDLGAQRIVTRMTIYSEDAGEGVYRYLHPEMVIRPHYSVLPSATQ
jgi:hypothetical protein